MQGATDRAIQARIDLQNARSAYDKEDRLGAALNLGFALVESMFTLADAVRSIDQTQKRKS